MVALKNVIYEHTIDRFMLFTVKMQFSQVFLAAKNAYKWDVSANHDPTAAKFC
jgi:hypothetical protein